MGNVTVKELIEILSKENKDDIICIAEITNDDKFLHSTLEIYRAYKNVEYINDDGNKVIGNIVALY